MEMSKKIIPHICTFVLFCIAALMTPIYDLYHSDGGNISGIIVPIILYVVAAFVLYKIPTLKAFNINVPDIATKNKKLLFIHYFIPIFFVGLIYLVVFFPGTGMIDTIYIIRWGGGMIGQHPWIYCLPIKLLTVIFTKLSIGFKYIIFTLALLQIIFCATVYALILMWMRIRNLSRIVVHIICAVYSLLPIGDLYMITIVKDVPFSLIILAWLPLLYECWDTEGEVLSNKTFLEIAVVLIFFSMLRNNGVYITGIIIVALFIMYGSKKFKQILVLFAALLMTILINSTVLRFFHVEHLFRETIGIPMQQMSAVVANDGVLSENDKDFLNNIMPLSKIKEQYDPYNFDTIKYGGEGLNDDYLNNNKKYVMKKWIDIGRNNPKIYMNAYLKATYGFWSINNTQGWNQAYYTLPKEFEGWYVENGFDIQDDVSNDKLASVIFFSLREGPLFWLFMILLASMAMRKGWRIYLIGIPILANWLSLMVSVPIAIQFRYVLCVMISIPTAIGIMLLQDREVAEN
ncbi:DUF6020 family protein [Butyrivibrio sp. XPD2002]|uniref:DUF6020 family protein n=1 Tax=Butyrivibrio sp. XPD2002 TaxID=1280665 RepID=UPI00042956E4|nr:DUF6020 family protein [Butyrivibrio sp. XPD2002]